MKIRTGYKYVGYFHYSEQINWAAQNLRLGRGLGIAALGGSASLTTRERQLLRSQLPLFLLLFRFPYHHH